MGSNLNAVLLWKIDINSLASEMDYSYVSGKYHSRSLIFTFHNYVMAHSDNEICRKGATYLTAVRDELRYGYISRMPINFIRSRKVDDTPLHATY
jgi:hypothetical protein